MTSAFSRPWWYGRADSWFSMMTDIKFLCLLPNGSKLNRDNASATPPSWSRYIAAVRGFSRACQTVNTCQEKATARTHVKNRTNPVTRRENTEGEGIAYPCTSPAGGTGFREGKLEA